MMNKAIFRAVVVVYSFASGIAAAVEPPEPVIQLFNEYLMTDVAGIDFAPDPGIGAIGSNERLKIIDAADPTKVLSRVKFNLRVNSSVGNTTLGTFNSYVDTRAYPDPDTAVSTSYFCADGGEVRAAAPNVEWFPCDYDINAGIANKGTTRYFVMSHAVYAWYVNSTDGEVDIGVAAVTVWDLESGTQAWRKTWNVTAGIWGLEDGTSAVGDFLSSNSGDEVRIAYWREQNNGKVEMKYTYYDIATGAEIKTDKFKVPVP